MPAETADILRLWSSTDRGPGITVARIRRCSMGAVVIAAPWVRWFIARGDAPGPAHVPAAVPCCPILAFSTTWPEWLICRSRRRMGPGPPAAYTSVGRAVTEGRTVSEDAGRY